VVQVKLKYKKAQLTLGSIATIAVLFVVAGITLGIGAEILDDIYLSVNNTATPANRTIASLAVANASEGLGELARWMPTIGLVIAAALIIGIVFTSFVQQRT